MAKANGEASKERDKDFDDEASLGGNAGMAMCDMLHSVRKLATWLDR